MPHITDYELIKKAKTVLYHRELYLGNRAGDVACALLSDRGHIYLGVCLDIGSGIGFCAEHSAIAAMITAGKLPLPGSWLSHGMAKCCPLVAAAGN